MSEFRVKCILYVAIILAVILLAAPVMAATTQVQIVKYANDNTTILNQTIVNYTWMAANLPVLGDGTTHYYAQGPVFVDNTNETLEQELRWNLAEDTNVLEKDMGAVKGTNLKDLCDLVGGMSPGEQVKILSSDGFSKWFAYDNVYGYSSREGPIGLTWYMDGKYPDSGYSDGIRLVWFADDSVNTLGPGGTGVHAFGNFDWHEAAASEYWYYYQSGGENYPTTTGLSSKYVNRVFIYSDDAPPVTPVELFNGTVTLLPGTNFTKVAYNSGSSYIVNATTPLGALNTAATTAGFTYDVTDKRWSYDQVLLLDNVSVYNKSAGKWFAYVNGIYKDGYGNHANGLNVIELMNNDQVNLFYSTGTNLTAPTDAIAAVKMKVNIPPPGPVVDILFNGTVTLLPGTNFTKVAYNSGSSYIVNATTPLGALNTAATTAGFTYDVTDKRWSYDQVLLLDNVSVYNKSAGKWFAYVNGIYKDGYGNHANGLNVIELMNNDQVNFFYSTGTNLTAPTEAIAAVKIKVNIGGSTPSDWSLSMKGAKTTTVTKTYFEQGLACSSSGHMVTWTDTEGNAWSGVPLWLLVAMVDDNPDVGSGHFNFNDTLAAQGYSVKINAGDGFNTTLASADIARNSGYIVANKLNGTDLPLLTPGGKRSWPLHLKGSAVFGGQQVGNITSIELTGMPQPSQGWTLTMEGDVVDVISQQYFEQAIVCHHNITYTDSNGRTWNGVPLWDLVGAVDDIETANHWTFNDTRVTTGYTVRVIAGDGFNSVFTSQNVSHNNGFIVANTLNGTPLSGSDGHLKLVGPATTSGSQRVGNITKIRLENLPSYPSGAYNLSLKGKISDVIPQPEIEAWIAGNSVTYTDSNGGVYSGIPLWRLLAWVDDRIPAGANGFNDAAAAAGYKVIVKAGDGYSKEFQSSAIARSNDFIVANTLNGTPLSTDGSHPPWPLRLVGAGATGGNSVGNIVEIELTDFQTVQTTTPLHIIKYGSDGVTIINETNVTYQWMEQNLEVIGNGTTVYKYEGLTMDPSNLWDPEETYPGGYKISNAVIGSRVRDLCDLVGGMGSGTEIRLIASDNFETILPYSSIYTNPAIQARQGDAILAWWGDGAYVPYYADGMRLFFTPNDTVYGQWDMHETLASNYWHYNTQNGVTYPSCAGLSAKLVTTIKIYSVPESDWVMELDGRGIGGTNSSVSKTFFEQALACQFGSDHKVTYTDSSGRIWEGMPLWFLCGFVDDADQHSSNAYNETKASAGYNITITARDGYNFTFDSRKTIRSNNYIVANTLNGTHINETDSSWPLRLGGQNVTGSQVVKKIASITLTTNTSLSAQTLSVVPASSAVPIGETSQYQVIMNKFPEGLSGFNITVSLDHPAIGEITTVSLPGWATLNTSSPVPADSVTLSAVDLPRSVEPGATNVVLGTFTLRSDSPGSTGLIIWINEIDADGGAVISPAIQHGQLIAYLPLIADFNAYPLSGTAPLTVNFTDLSTGDPLPGTWDWDFNGDGIVDSTAQNPQFVYVTPGNYTVNLTVTNAFNADTAMRTSYIQVRHLVEPFPGYTNIPTDPDGDNLYEDINGNGRLDFDDVVAYYQNMAWITANTRVGIAPYDFNHNGRIDFDDVVLLYEEVLNV